MSNSISQDQEMNERLYEILKKDDNEEILKLLKSRMELGKRRYGHGVIVDEDVTVHGPETNDWELMALEEALDGMIYSAAAIIRLQRIKIKDRDNHQALNLT